MKSLKLNLGSGTRKLEGYVNVDIDKATKPDIVCDLDKYPYPFKTSSADEIFTEHCLEHLADPLRSLKEIRRVLKPRARLVVRVPHYSYGGVYDVTHKSFWCVETFNLDYVRELFVVKKITLKWFRHGWRQRKLYYPFFLAQPVIDFLANLSPVFCDRFWCRLVGGFEEVEFELRAKK